MRKKGKKSVQKSVKRSKGIRAYIQAFYIGIVSVIVLSLVFVYLKETHKTAFCANSISCIKDLSGKFDPEAKEGEFLGQKISVPEEIADTNPPQNVLGTETSGPKHIYVDLSKQALYAYEGDKKVYDFAISSGKWHPTPSGNFNIWIKLRYTRMTGGSGADFYDLPNVPYTMFFASDTVGRGQGFSLHGAYWHNNFGHPMSHGCVNMRIEDAHKIFDWATPATTGFTTYATADDPGTPITIFGVAPDN